MQMQIQIQIHMQMQIQIQIHLFCLWKGNFVAWRFLLVKQLEKINPHVAPPDLTLYNNAKAIMASHNLSHCNKYSIYIIVNRKWSIYTIVTKQIIISTIVYSWWCFLWKDCISKFSQGLILISWHLGIVTNVESWQSGIMTMWHRVTNHWNVWLNPNAPGWHYDHATRGKAFVLQIVKQRRWKFPLLTPLTPLITSLWRSLSSKTFSCIQWSPMCKILQTICGLQFYKTTFAYIACAEVFRQFVGFTNCPGDTCPILRIGQFPCAHCNEMSKSRI